MVPTVRKRSHWFPLQTVPASTPCEAGRMTPEAHTHNRCWEVPLRRAQRRRKYDGLVTSAECARTQIPDIPLPPPSQVTRFNTSGLSRFLLPTFLCGRQRKVGAPRTGGTLI